MEVVGKSMKRVDAFGKVTGEAKYTNDLCPKDALIAHVVHSTIANGEVLSIDTSEAEKVPGVVKIVTCFDVPDIQFPTAGHPWSVEAAHQDIADRKLLNTRVRLYGDDIAAIVGVDNVACEHAERLLKIEYKEYPPFTTVEDALKPEATPLHPDLRKTNELIHTSFKSSPDYDYEQAKERAVREYGAEHVREYEQTYRTQRVSHCHIEVATSWAYVDVNGKVTVTASTQIPHIMRRVIAQALGWPVGKVRVIKPYLGGGFGNKQDILYEPLNAYLSVVCGGRCVCLETTREECISQTRVRHAVIGKTKALYTTDGRLLARTLDGYANKGAYASHGHAIAASVATVYKDLYNDAYGCRADMTTVFTNSASAGAMRAYGVPQSVFLADCQIDDICHREGFDPLKFRMDNCVGKGFRDPGNGITYYSYSMKECMRRGAEYIHWDEKRKAYANQTGPIRHGVGMSIFMYKVGVYPISLETSSARMILNQDGSIQVELSATEIGQGADTVFTQMASETTGITPDKVYIVSTQDTDLAPFDTGAYASRQSFVTGKAVKKCGLELRNRILDYAAYMLGRPVEELMIHDNNICERIPEEGTTIQTDLSAGNGYGYVPDGSVDENDRYQDWLDADVKHWNIDDLPSGRKSILRDTGKILAKPGKVLLSMKDLAENAFYSLDRSEHITAEVTNHCKENTYASGCTFADITVDMEMGTVKIDHLVNVHDSGTLLNPQLAEAQVHGGMAMGIGYALSEELLYNEKGRPLNNNLLDFKIPTALDVPDLKAIFLQMDDPMGPYGNKALGEPPVISVAPAIRNAILNATGVAMNELPMTQQRLVAAFQQHGLI
jgi:xanthine dehydrogenase molybdenum-binding subunit